MIIMYNKINLCVYPPTLPQLTGSVVSANVEIGDFRLSQ